MSSKTVSFKIGDEVKVKRSEGGGIYYGHNVGVIGVVRMVDDDGVLLIDSDDCTLWHHPLTVELAARTPTETQDHE